MSITAQDLKDDEDNYKRAQWETFFDRLEEWINAVVIDRQSIHVGDSVYARELRKDLIESLIKKEFDL